MSHVRRFDHIGITVADLDAVTAFFVGLALYDVMASTCRGGAFRDVGRRSAS